MPVVSQSIMNEMVPVGARTDACALRTPFASGASMASSRRRWRENQRRRFEAREHHPLKQGKLSPVDRASLDKWDEYTEAKEAMFVQTDTLEAPWTIIKSDCKKRARLNALRFVLHSVPYEGKDVEAIGDLDPLIVNRADLLAADA